MALLRADHWHGQANQGEEIADVSEKGFAAAIDRLDGCNRAQVSLVAKTNRLLTIGGGPDRFFVQYILPDDAGEWLAVGDPDVKGEERLALGRQQADYPRRHIVSKTVALDAGRAFLRGGGRSKTVAWKRSF